MKRPLLLFAPLIALLLLFLLAAGWWRSSGVGPQVQVPMFYDAHYLFPRPWTQAQEAPGVPNPAPISALYGPNRVTQTFLAGADRLAMVEFWMAGPVGAQVQLLLVAPDRTQYAGEATVDEPGGRFYRFTFPIMQAAKGAPFTLTLAAPEQEWDQPVTLRSIAGDRLGAAIQLNEYSRPGNLELYTYSRGGLPGRWWSDAVGEQLLPAAFRIRLQQYKPDPFKGELFAVLLLAMLILTTFYLVLARPSGRRLATALAWALLVAAGAFLIWQLGTGRARPPGLAQSVALQHVPADWAFSDVPQDERRLVHDLPLTLWTAARYPEERFVTTELGEERFPGVQFSAIRAPADSALRFTLTAPLAGQLALGAEVLGEGELLVRVLVEEQELVSQNLTPADQGVWFELPLDAWAGQDVILTLESVPLAGAPDVRWWRPQILADHAAWLPANMPGEAHETTFRFGEQITLLGYRLEPEDPRPGEPATVTLYWRTDAPVDADAKVFVHLLDVDGQIQAQHDARPVSNSYPLSVWQPGQIVADAHTLIWPDLPLSDTGLAVGLYQPDTFVRWPVFDAAGVRQPNDRALLPLSDEENGAALDRPHTKPVAFRRHATRPGDVRRNVHRRWAGLSIPGLHRSPAAAV